MAFVTEGEGQVPASPPLSARRRATIACLRATEMLHHLISARAEECGGQQALAKSLNVAPSLVNDIVTKKRLPKLPLLLELAYALDMPLLELLDLPGESWSGPSTAAKTLAAHRRPPTTPEPTLDDPAPVGADRTPVEHKKPRR
jgi:transcriptional regulator with XRE-family HTH domain